MNKFDFFMEMEKIERKGCPVYDIIVSVIFVFFVGIILLICKWYG
jgi:hypothetical protein